MTRIRLRGAEYRVDIAGVGHPLLLLHGFTGSAETWHRIRTPLEAQACTIALDLLGHGRSSAPADAQRYVVSECVADLVALLDGLGVERADVLGYSMGGRIALCLAAAAPQRVRALIVLGASPGIADAGERAARRAADEALARDIERDGVPAFVDRWERLPLFASQHALAAEERARIRAERHMHTAIGLANSLRGAGVGAQPSLWGRLSEMRVPALFLAGELDAKYRDLAEEVAASMPEATAAIIAGAGHAAHLEQPAAFSDAVIGALGDVGAMGVLEGARA